MFYAIDYEALQNANTRRIPLGDLLSDDAELIPDLLADANVETARDLAQTLLLNQGFEDLTKKSLLARFIKKFPTVSEPDCRADNRKFRRRCAHYFTEEL